MANTLLGFLVATFAGGIVANLLAADRFLAAMRDEAPHAWAQLGEPGGLTKLGIREFSDFRQIMRDADLLEPAPRMLYWRRLYRVSAALGVISFGLLFLGLGLAVP